MLDKFNSFLRTTLLLALVLVIGWWTLFLRGQLTEHERDLEGRDERIETLSDQITERQGEIDELNTSLEERDGRIETLGEDLAARDTRITELGKAIQILDAAVAAGKQRIEELGVELEESQAEARRLAAAVALLKVDHRIARLEILERFELEEDGETGIWTRVRFTELNQAGEAIGSPREIIVAGARVYVEALVIKFEDDYVEGGDFLRGSSVCLFQRLFGEAESPSEGTVLEAAGTLPAIYAGDDLPDPFYRDLWARFWEYAADPEAAKQAGVRAVHGEAPFIEAIPGTKWRIELRSSGGLTIVPE